MAFITDQTKNLISRFKNKGKPMETASLIIKCDKQTLRRLKERGMFSDDPQWLFNTHMVLASVRDMVFRPPYHDLEKIERFLASEEIPYIRTLKGN